MITEEYVLNNCLHNSDEILKKVYFPLFRKEFSDYEQIGVAKVSNYSSPVYARVDFSFDDWKLLRYKELRAARYPKIEEQIDMFYHDSVEGTNKAIETLSKIKSDYPKPDSSWFWFGYFSYLLE